MTIEGKRPGGALTGLSAGQQIPFGGDRVAVVSDELARDFAEGDRLVVVHDTGDLLHIPRAEVEAAAGAVSAAEDAFRALAAVDDAAISRFFALCAEYLEDDERFAPIRDVNQGDVEAAERRGRSTGRLVLTPKMRADMVAGLLTWRDMDGDRDRAVANHSHDGWNVTIRRAPLGVVGFVFEGRPNVLTDACGVVRTGNTAVMRIGRDALATARAIIARVIEPAALAAGLPGSVVRLVDSPTHASGWALFCDERLGLAVARGSGPAVAQLGAVARQHGIPASLHGTGGAWIVADAAADTDAFERAVRNSLDRKVCNTLNVCAIVADRADDLVPVFERAVADAAGKSANAVRIHRLVPGHPDLATEWEWDAAPEVSLLLVDDLPAAIAECNRFSPHFVASLVSEDPEAQAVFYRDVDAPFVGNGFTRWVDGQYALDKPELGLSNWQFGRLFARAGVLSGDSVHTVRMAAEVTDHDVRR